MDKPSENQIREFWEWCGLVKLKREDIGYKIPGSSGDLIYGDIDLNNLFKYAVPELNRQGKTVVISQWVEEQTFSCLVVDKSAYNETISSEYYSDPALALFWAIWQVMKGG